MGGKVIKKVIKRVMNNLQQRYYLVKKNVSIGFFLIEPRRMGNNVMFQIKRIKSNIILNVKSLIDVSWFQMIQSIL